jgi:hypothetical protein
MTWNLKSGPDRVKPNFPALNAQRRQMQSRHVRNARGPLEAPRGNTFCSQMTFPQLMAVPVLGTTRSQHGE